MKHTETIPQYRVIIDLDASIETCFEVCTHESAMMRWVAGAKSIVYNHSKSIEPYGAGSERSVKAGPGKPMIERIIESEKPNFLAYCVPSFGRIGDKLIKNYNCNMSFTRIDQNRTRLTWEGYFNSPALIQPLIRKLLNSVTKKMANNIKNYITHDQMKHYL